MTTHDLPRTDGYRLTALAALLLGPIVWMGIWAAGHAYRPRSLVAMLIAAALIGALVSGITRRTRWFFLAMLPLFVLSLLFLAYSVTFSMLPGRTLAALIVGTSWEEVRGFATLTEGRRLAEGLIVAIALYLYLTLTLTNRAIFVGRVRTASRALVVVLVPLTAYAAWSADETIDGFALNPMAGSVMFLSGTVPTVAEELKGSSIQKIPYHATRQGEEEVHVLVVGESARRASWSVYGYARPTTPFLNSLRGEATFFENAVADANLTEAAVPILLTGMTPEEFPTASIHGNIVDLAKEAGYSTAWLLNQDISISTSVGISADRLEYPPDFKATINGRRTLDETLLPAYRREIAAGGRARFIGLHLMGSHWEYFRRYPEAFQRYGSTKDISVVSIFVNDAKTEAAVVDSYDNSVLYTDWMLKQIVEGARTLRVPATITYFPDHGEDLQALDGESGHGQPRYTPHAFAIPAFIWMNEAYRNKYPERAAALARNAAKEVRTHNVFETEAELMGIERPGALPQRSIVSERFVPDVDMRYFAGGVLVPRS